MLSEPTRWFSRWRKPDALRSRVLDTVESTRSLAAAERVPSGTGVRGLDERLRARSRRPGEALSPAELRGVRQHLDAVADARVSEVEGARHADRFWRWHQKATPEQRVDAWRLLAQRYGPSAQALSAAAASAGLADEVKIRQALSSSRTRVVQRLAAAPQGMERLLALRVGLLNAVREEPSLRALDAEIESLLATWFDVGSLELRRISWDSPAALIEKLIRYEAVHAVRNWDDMKNRLDSDRRCYGFFHPRLPQDPLIFVEVALTTDLSDSIAPLLDESAALLDPQKADTAIFYSISNAQPGLRGVGFGDSLIKQVVDALREEFPRLRRFATLSPIPGLRQWLMRHAQAPFRLPEGLAPTDMDSTQVQHLQALAARYLTSLDTHGLPLDPVARFHLGNGARVERLNWAGDLSPKGLDQSLGMMVNYLYDLTRLDRHRDELAAGRVPQGRSLSRWLKLG